MKEPLPQRIAGSKGLFSNEEVLEEVKAVRWELEGKATLGRRDE